MNKERIDQLTTQIMHPYEEGLPKGFTEFYQALSRRDSMSSVEAFSETKGWGSDSFSSLPLRLSGKAVTEMLEGFNDRFISHIDSAFKLDTHFDEAITKAFVLLAGARAMLLTGSEPYEAHMYVFREKITKQIEASTVNIKLRLGAMKLYDMLGKDLPETEIK